MAPEAGPPRKCQHCGSTNTVQIDESDGGDRVFCFTCGRESSYPHQGTPKVVPRVEPHGE